MKIKIKLSVLVITGLLLISCSQDVTNNKDITDTLVNNSRAPINTSGEDLIGRFFDRREHYLKTENINGLDVTYINMQAKGKVNPVPGHLTTSEAMAYGMRLAIYGFKSIKSNSQSAAYRKRFYEKTFKNLWILQQNFKSTEDSRLHSWIIPSSLKASDSSACKTDSEMDMAYALLQAHKLWGSNGGINYKYEASRILDGIAASLTNTVQLRTDTNNIVNVTYLKVGDWMDNNQANAFYSRPSDWMPHHFKTFMSFLASEGRYGTYTFNKFESLLESLDYLYGSSRLSGDFYPDFVYFNPLTKEMEPATPGSQFDIDMDEDVSVNKYSWNSCRIPWRLGMDSFLDYEQSPFSTTRTILRGIFVKAYNGNSNRTGMEYDLNGREIDQNYSVAFAAPFVAAVNYLKVDSYNKNLYVKSVINREMPRLLSNYTANPDWGYYGDAILCFSVLLLERDRSVIGAPY